MTMPSASLAPPPMGDAVVWIRTTAPPSPDAFCATVPDNDALNGTAGSLPAGTAPPVALAAPRAPSAPCAPAERASRLAGVPERRAQPGLSGPAASHLVPPPGATTTAPPTAPRTPGRR